MTEESDQAYVKACELINKLAEKHPVLPFQPETIASARRRFPRALREASNPLELIEGKGIPPSINRVNVFDFEDGIRMIVSLDDLVISKKIHVSASYTTEGADVLLGSKKTDAEKLAMSPKAKKKIARKAKSKIEQRFEAIAPGLQLVFLMVTPIGAFHFIAEEKDDEQT